MPKSKTQRVVFQPRTRQSIQAGMNQVVNAVRPTLGPQPRGVAIDNTDYYSEAPEFIDNGGTIARYIIQLQDKDADMGAMLVRDLLWRLQEQIGDGTATAAVIFQKVFNEGVRFLTAGGNAMRLQVQLLEGARLILQQLNSMTWRIAGKKQLAQAAETLCFDPTLAGYMGEVFEIIGEYGRLEIRPGQNRNVEREYVEGMYWERGLLVREMYADHSKPRVEFEDAAILISDIEINDARQIYPALELALRAEIQGLLIVTKQLSGDAIGFLLSNRKPEKFQAIAVKTPGLVREEQMAALEDLAILTGGRPFISAAGDTLDKIKIEDFGRARRIWANYDNFGISGGKGNPRDLRRHVATLRQVYTSAETNTNRTKIQKRIGKLLGGSATLHVGGITEREIESRVELAKRTAVTLRGAMMDGVLAGGGVAFLDSRPALLRKRDNSTDSEQHAAYQILIEAMEAPFRTIVDNAGFDASEIMAEVRLAGAGHGFDVKKQQVVDMAQAQIYDAATVLKGAMFGAVSTAAMALTIDALVHQAQVEKAPLPKTPKRKQL
ncbi:MAG TPA: chaperonin GroEL [candidate division Zixibacteria bacterium]|nr:chaperonin GroEL [candidate division Zixibacteria bacterium]